MPGRCSSTTARSPRAMRTARGELERVFDGAEEAPLEVEEALGDYARVREEVVTSLAADVAAAARAEGADLAFMDLSGAVKGYATGRPTGDAAPSIAWQLGVDVPAIAKVCGSLEAIGYARDPERLRIDLEAYRRLVGDTPVNV